MNLSKLRVVGANNTADDVVKANLEATFARPYEALSQTNDDMGPVSIVGSGPSLASTYRQLVGDVIACNSAHDFLISKGVIPKYAMVWDANPVMKDILTPHKDVTYLLASRCHPSLFEKLKGHKVLVWHALGGDKIEDHIRGSKAVGQLLIPGGCASAMRAPYVAGCLGYKKEIHFFGVDSCYANGETHVSGSIVEQGRMDLVVCGKRFSVAPWMVIQGDDAKFILPDLMKLGARIVVHGSGLIPYLCTLLHGIETPDIKVTLREHIRREFHFLRLLYLELRTSPQLLGGSHAGI